MRERRRQTVTVSLLLNLTALSVSVYEEETYFVYTVKKFLPLEEKTCNSSRLQEPIVYG